MEKILHMIEITRLNDCGALFHCCEIPEENIVFKKEMTREQLLKFLNYSKKDIKKFKRDSKLFRGCTEYYKRKLTYCLYKPLGETIYKDSNAKEGYYE